MSLLTGEPKGRVVFVVVDKYNNVTTQVDIVYRTEIRRVEHGQNYCVCVVDYRSETRSFPVFEPDGDEATHTKIDRMRKQIFDSLVAEDVDVIWTRRGNNYTRTPDLKP